MTGENARYSGELDLVLDLIQPEDEVFMLLKSSVDLDLRCVFH